MRGPTRNPTIPSTIIAEIRRRAAAGLKWGDQKVIAIDLNVSTTYVSQIINGYRRKAA